MHGSCFETPPLAAPQHEGFPYIYRPRLHAEERPLARLEAWAAGCDHRGSVLIRF